MGIESERPSYEHIEAVWAEEAEQRLTEIDADTVELIPWEEVRAELLPLW